MRRTTVMTIGFVLIFIGIQLNLVQTFVLTPRVSNFLSEQAASQQFPPQAPAFNNAFPSNAAAQNNPSAQQSPYYQASYGTPNQPQNGPVYTPVPSVAQKALTPPNWLCWPILFLGTVVFLHGFSMRRD